MGVVWGEDDVIALSLLWILSCTRRRESSRALSKGLSSYLCRAIWTLTVSLLILLFRSSYLSLEYFRDIFTYCVLSLFNKKIESKKIFVMY